MLESLKNAQVSVNMTHYNTVIAHLFTGSMHIDSPSQVK